MKWVKASERLPGKQGVRNSVIVKYIDDVYYGFKNYSTWKPKIYIPRLGILTTECLWLDESYAKNRSIETNKKRCQLSEALHQEI